MRRKSKNLRASRKGSIVVLTAFFMVVLIGLMAFVVDLGNQMRARVELQRTADSAAMAACWEYGNQLSKGNAFTVAAPAARTAAQSAATANPILKTNPTLDANSGNASAGEIVIGQIADVTQSPPMLSLSNNSTFNAVQVTVKRTAQRNGKIPFQFAKIFGVDGIDTQATATAALVRYVKGFKTTSDSSNIDILPIACDQTSWNNLMAGNGNDSWNYNPNTKTVTSGSDGIKELNIYPIGNGSPGNRGTVDIGSSNNSTADLSRQVLNGISQSDLSYHGGKLEFGANGTLTLNGDTGISAGIKDELASIKGKPRIIPIFTTVQGPGNNAMYTIVKWVGVRIVDVNLTGSMNSKRVVVQPAPIVSKGIIPTTTTTQSENVFSNVFLLQ